MPQTRRTIRYGSQSIAYRLTRSRRKSLEIAVHPDGEVVVKAPLETDESVVEQRVHKRARWISRQILHFAQFEPRTPERRFVGGESHLYLGRKYRLKITPSDTDSVSLRRGFFFITVVDHRPAHIAALLEKWYRGKAEIHFARVLERCWPPFGSHGMFKPAFKIRRMKTRWGSLSGRGVMTLNLELIKAPVECIEYVVIHELCHLSHPHHGPGFYRLLETQLPDWAKLKHKLETALC
ncbi:MAG: SprT family zinc-dependent metalloprotease [Gammaproteobacteria bacterium]|nr:SprT family zinc-dependent metalloprotease [Gammaproteobacteria bacterium]